MEVKTTKERVLEASKHCEISKRTLKILFPEVFNECKAMESLFRFGDIVVVVDGSNNKDKKTGKKRFGIDPLFKNHKAVVIETNLSIETHLEIEYYKNKGEVDSWMYSDLLLRFETGEEVYTSSKMCRLFSGF